MWLTSNLFTESPHFLYQLWEEKPSNDQVKNGIRLYGKIPNHIKIHSGNIFLLSFFTEFPEIGDDPIEIELLPKNRRTSCDGCKFHIVERKGCSQPRTEPVCDESYSQWSKP